MPWLSMAQKARHNKFRLDRHIKCFKKWRWVSYTTKSSSFHFAKVFLMLPSWSSSSLSTTSFCLCLPHSIVCLNSRTSIYCSENFLCGKKLFHLAAIYANKLNLQFLETQVHIVLRGKWHASSPYKIKGVRQCDQMPIWQGWEREKQAMKEKYGKKRTMKKMNPFFVPYLCAMQTMLRKSHFNWTKVVTIVHLPDIPEYRKWFRWVCRKTSI